MRTARLRLLKVVRRSGIETELLKDPEFRPDVFVEAQVKKTRKDIRMRTHELEHGHMLRPDFHSRALTDLVPGDHVLGKQVRCELQFLEPDIFPYELGLGQKTQK
jgi:hypothetical protein